MKTLELNKVLLAACAAVCIGASTASGQGLTLEDDGLMSDDVLMNPVAPYAETKLDLTAASLLDSEVSAYQGVIKGLHANDCQEVPVKEADDVVIAYLYCPASALRADSASRKLTDQFVIPSALARKVKFWERVFARWSIDDQVLHLADYPEVVFEVANSSRVSSPYNSIRKYRAQAKLAERAETYRVSLLALAERAEGRSIEMTETMRRVEKLMSHIDDPAKYRKGAERIRIQRGQKDFLKRGIETSSRYLSQIEREFELRGLPKELSRLAFIESTFNMDAVSSVGASGVYQIMPETGRHYMIVNDLVDERRDPIKSGMAAAELLKLYHELAGSWPLAVTAYNHGIGSILRGVNQTGSQDIGEIIANYRTPSFGFASKNFFAEFLAMVDIINNVSTHFEDLRYELPVEYDSIHLEKDYSMAEAEREFGFNMGDVVDLNPDLSDRFIAENHPLPSGYVLKIPARFKIQQLDVARIPTFDRSDDVARMLVAE